MNAAEVMIWTWFVWAGAAVWYIGYLRAELQSMTGFAKQLYAERDAARKALANMDDAVDIYGAVVECDELLDAMAEIVDAPDLATAREIACNVLDLPIYPQLRRSA